jgi:hypothetical protein
LRALNRRFAAAFEVVLSLRVPVSWNSEQAMLVYKKTGKEEAHALTEADEEGGAGK